MIYIQLQYTVNKNDYNLLDLQSFSTIVVPYFARQCMVIE